MAADRRRRSRHRPGRRPRRPPRPPRTARRSPRPMPWPAPGHDRHPPVEPSIRHACLLSPAVPARVDARVPGSHNASRVTDVAAPDRLDGITIRRATPADFAADLRRGRRGGGSHLARTRGWTASSRPATPPSVSSRFGASALRHDPDGFWVAEVDGALVGFGIAVQREHVWYLAALHVRPAYQSRGLGAEIIRRALAAARPGSLLTVGADARNPVSNALYGRFGMFPETPLLEVAGPAGGGRYRHPQVPGLPPADDPRRHRPRGRSTSPAPRTTTSGARCPASTRSP